MFWYQPSQEQANQYMPLIWFNTIPYNVYPQETSLEPSEILTLKSPVMDGQPGNSPFQREKLEKLLLDGTIPDGRDKKTDNKKSHKCHSSSIFPKDKEELRKDQNIFRNIMPNIIHQVVIFVQKKSKSKKFVEKMLGESPQGQCWSVNRFYLYQQLIKEKTSHYLNEEILSEYKKIQEIECELYPLEEQVQYLRISRGLVFYFLRCYMRNSVLTSSRMKPEIKNGHLQLLRQLEERILNIYEQ